jgi:hypothetical protein
VTIKDDWQALGRPIISYDLMFRFVGITVNRRWYNCEPAPLIGALIAVIINRYRIVAVTDRPTCADRELADRPRAQPGPIGCLFR